MDIQERERLVKIETNVEFLVEKLTDHITWEDDKYKEMDVRFASKEYERLVQLTDQKVDSLPDKLSKRYAGIWVENWTKAVAFTMIGSITIALVLKFLV